MNGWCRASHVACLMDGPEEPCPEQEGTEFGTECASVCSDV